MKFRQILIIDDNDADLLFTEVILQTAEIAESVVAFGTATDALEYLRDRAGCATDIILLDINMPEMNGFEFLDVYEELRAHDQARASVVMLTSSPSPSDRARAATYAAVKRYFVKPIDVDSAQMLITLAAAQPIQE